MNAYPRSHLRAAILLAIVLGIVITTLPADQGEPSTTPISLEVKPRPAPTLTTDAALVAAPPKVREQWTTISVKSGDNLAKIFQRLQLSAADLQEIVDLGKTVKSLKKIMPGQELSFLLNPEGELLAVRYEENPFDTLTVTKTDSGFSANWVAATPEHITVFETANITKDNPSLYHAGKDAGLSDNIIMKLSYVFQWDISFALDLRAGDSFSLMYEEIYVDGEKVKEGDILAASFTNMGKRHDAIRYVDLSGRADYYTPEGHSMRKAFIRDPVHFSHISSRFNPRRLHPIHKRAMPHRGIDYAAKTGTPVVASGDGKVTIRRQNDASGKYIVLQHGEQYTTKYLHLSAFARGVKPGANVKQGQTIGYVGSTGWATGPHLHYEFLVNGVHRNPKTVSLPKASPVAKDELQRFRKAISPLLAQLEAISGKGYASAKGNLDAGD